MSADTEANYRSVIEQAARWYVRCADGEALTLQESKEMEQWLRASPEHELELANMFRLDALLVAYTERRRQRYQ